MDQDEDEKTVPDRKAFEEELKRINTHIDASCKEIKYLKNNCLAMNPEMQEYRDNRAKMEIACADFKQDLTRIRTEKDELRKQAFELEKDCRFRDMTRLEAHLSMQEKRYNEESLTLRNESVLVQEIETLRKNKVKLQKLLEIQALRKEVDKKYDVIYTKRNNLLLAADLKKKEFSKLHKKRKMVEDSIEKMKQTLRGYYGKRNDLIDTYDKNRKEYNSWIKSHKRRSKSDIPLTFPVVQRFTNTLEEEELEPFYEQKRDCRRLLNYLEQQKMLLPASEQQESTQGSSDDDSADDLPPNLAKLNISVKPLTNKQRKLVKRATQPMSHQLEIYRLFTNIEVNPPEVYSDVPRAIEQVKEKLEFFEEQTNEIVWNEEDWKIEPVIISRTNSTYTGFDDSLSESNSHASCRLVESRNSCQSPLSTDHTTID